MKKYLQWQVSRKNKAKKTQKNSYNRVNCKNTCKKGDFLSKRVTKNYGLDSDQSSMCLALPLYFDCLPFFMVLKTILVLLIFLNILHNIMKNCVKLSGCGNVSIETWIRATKFNWRIPIRSEDINKMQTEFSRNGKFSWKGMHRVAARNISGQGRFVGIEEINKYFVLKHIKGKILEFFS